MLSTLFSQGSEEIQYLGTCYTQDCINAVTFIIQTQSQIEKALLLSHNHYHGFLIRSARSTYIIRSGFTSDSGEGSKGLASALQLLLKHEIEVEEVNIPSKIMTKLNRASLSDTDIKIILNTKFVRPIKIYEYIYAIYKNIKYQEKNNSYYSYELPYALIDSRIFDLALKFKDEPDSAIITAYRRLEDIVHSRINSNKFSSDLFEYAFCSDKSPLQCKAENEKASIALGRLFVNTYKAFRNERAHSEVNKPDHKLVREFLLINELYLLESEAIERIS